MVHPARVCAFPLIRTKCCASRSEHDIFHDCPFAGSATTFPQISCFAFQMKGEMVRPGAVVYTAALAECRWAGEQKHFDYLLKEMESEGVSIAPGTSQSFGRTEGNSKAYIGLRDVCGNVFESMFWGDTRICLPRCAPVLSNTLDLYIHSLWHCSTPRM